jgi:hypothetical protein
MFRFFRRRKPEPDTLTRLAEDWRAAARGPAEPYSIPWAGEGPGATRFVVLPTASEAELASAAEAALAGTSPAPAAPAWATAPPRRPSLFRAQGSDLASWPQ